MPKEKNQYSKRKSADNTDYSELEAEEVLSDDISKDDESMLLKQIEKEHKEAHEFMIPKMEEWRRRLQLFNNQKKSPKQIGEPLMFSIFQTILASLYDDKLGTNFLGREEGDEEVAENLNLMAEYDYDQMDMNVVLYDWTWDTCFFGRGLVLLNEFDRRDMHPVPEVIDPLTFLRDPNASSVNGYRGRHGMKFGGQEIRMTQIELDANPAYYNTDMLMSKQKDNQTKLNYAEPNINDLTSEAERARAEAQGHNYNNLKGEAAVGDNVTYRLIRWFTHFNGYKVLVVCSDDFKVMVRFQYLTDDEGHSVRYWPIIDRALYPSAHDWDGTSIPDLTEDKQRMMGIIENLLLDGAKADVYPMYVYDRNKITNQSDLDFGFNKMIGVPGNPENVVTPLRKYNFNSVMVDYILKTMDNSAQKATATPEIQQGSASDEQRTLGELNMISSKVDTRYSLTLKVFGWSEKLFWRQWYRLYKMHFDEHIDEKTIRIVGAFGSKWRKLQRENIVAAIDPDIEVESIVIAEAKRLREYEAFTQFAGYAMQDPEANKRYILKKMARLNAMKKDEIDRMFPQTPDEMIAENENMILSEDRLSDPDTGDKATVKGNDNHRVHLEIHAMAADTPATRAHIKAHKAALRLQSRNPELFAQPGAEGMQPGQEAGVPAEVAGSGGIQLGGTNPSQLAAPAAMGGA